MIFQYIPCYCLSFKPLRSEIRCLYFNTSHVTVYRNNQLHDTCRYQFQYIPCYCLSCFHVFRIIIRMLFQYIPCYCLSLQTNPTYYYMQDFNTSHVTVYLTNSIHFSCKPLRHFLYFTLFPPFLPAVCKI